MTDPLLVLVFVVLGATALGVGVVSLARGRSERRWGRFVAADAGRAVTLRSDRYRLVGRPDLLREAPDGRLVPVELKHRKMPDGGPYPSHRTQLAAYCLLVEETTGRPPPFGVLRYADREVVLPWDAASRRRLLATLAAVRAPYRGDADPSPAKCAGCPWEPRCDASLAPAHARRAT
ncbi:MAG TPA: PD-(D/E)XK nuclease family protein [Thermoplasmata archaeon]|nr:PD-(D/E)XK nuclease family protein [Thermoplasmata archaeon]